MKKALLFIAVCCAFTLSSCGPRMNNGKMVTEQRQLSEFTSIDISAPVDATITVRPGAAPSVSIKGYSDVLKKIKAEVEGNMLHIYSESKHWRFHSGESTKVEIVVGSLSALDVSGAADVDILGNITGPEFNLAVSGAGDLKIDEINTDKLSIDAAGAADVSIKKGSVRQAEYDFSGAGDLKAFDLVTTETRASVSGAGDVKVNVSQTLNASISGVGSIRYKGHPAITKSVSGIGEISDAN